MQLIFTSVLLTFVLLLAGCHSHNRNKEIDVYLDQEIKDRMLVITGQPDSLSISPFKIDKEINVLLLMMKDLENITSAVTRANSYFKGLASSHHLEAASFALIDPAMDPDEITSRLKENELSFFNQVIFKSGISGSQIYTAH